MTAGRPGASSDTPSGDRALPTGTLRRVERAFAGVPRPNDEALLHPECRDDGDLQALYGFDDWRQVPDDVVVNEYAALAFLSAAGFRHFIPAFLIWVLRHPQAPEAVVDSTVWAFYPSLHGALAPFVRSKWELLDPVQRDAVAAFLTAMVPYHADAEAALGEWST